MVRRRERQRSVWEVVLPDASKLWPADLRRIDTLLEDAAVLDPIVAALEARWAQSRRRGRPGTPAEVVLRMLVLKHLYRWSYDTLEHEVRANLVYRAFACVGAGAVPDAKTILKIARVLDPAVIRQVHDRIVALAVERKVTRGRRLRVDTTVVETNVHYPTDSTLLRDSVRVITRTLQRAGAVLGGAAPRVRNRLRSVGRHVLAIAKTARRGAGETAHPRIYRRLMAQARAVLRDGDTIVRRIANRVRTVVPAGWRALEQARAKLVRMRPQARRVLAQTRARVLGRDTHEHHFGRAPDLATGDRGYSSAANKAAATARGVRRVILPKAGPKPPERRAHEQQRWFRRGMRWWVGPEGRNSVLKRRHDLQRCRYHGADGVT